MPDSQVVVIARADDATFGILHSRFHELWSLRMCTWLGVGNDPRYTPTTCFETFPFPAGLTPADTAHQRTEAIEGGALVPAGLSAQKNASKQAPAHKGRAQAAIKTVAIGDHAAHIASAAKRLNDLRENWLNPPEWTQRLPEVIPLGMAKSPYPDRIVPKNGHEKELAERTLTKLYNQRPAWLDVAHKALDAAVAAAYGWTDYRTDMPDEEILKRLLALNLQRATSQGAIN
ncbi:type IIL restriction-modification enzyme MmeI [Polaromonas hydrogenivorans]|uniref:type IIL restriction-modification enzyme MmeI n=1 Tax=Polaromonas hydrogenivorans TaxID=335476 RepID=UPI0039EE0B87